MGSAYTGLVSGFGQNTHQFIDFTAIGSGGTLHYTSTGADSGILSVSNGGVFATVDLIGHYTSASFKMSAGVGGSVEIVDPPLPAKQPADIGFGANLTLFANYIAASFPTAAGGDFSNLISAGPLSESGQPRLTHPHG